MIERKIAIVHEYMTKIGGAEKVLLALSNLYPEAPIYTFLYDEKGTKGLFKGKKIITSGLQNYPAFLRKPRLLLPKYPQAVEQFDLSEYDIVISSSNSFAHGVITKPTTFHLCYCHSPMRYVWDWYHEYLRENKIGFGLKGLYIRSVLKNIRVWDRAAAERVDFWLANSKNVQDRIKKYYRKDSIVLYPPVDVEKIELNEQKDDFYLILSRLEPYKKIDLAIKAFNKLGKKLVIIGTGSAESELKKLANKNIDFLGWQADETVKKMLGQAKALIFPGEDDFGIVPVEAMAAGTPVIALNAGGTKETIILEKTGMFFDEESAESIVDAIERFEKITFSAQNCRDQAEKFSTEKFNSKFQEILDREYNNYLRNI